MEKKDLKERAAAAAAFIGFCVAGMMFWKLVTAFMWLCFDAGFKM